MRISHRGSPQNSKRILNFHAARKVNTHYPALHPLLGSGSPCWMPHRCTCGERRHLQMGRTSMLAISTNRASRVLSRGDSTTSSLNRDWTLSPNIYSSINIPRKGGYKRYVEVVTEHTMVPFLSHARPSKPIILLSVVLTDRPSTWNQSKGAGLWLGRTCGKFGSCKRLASHILRLENPHSSIRSPWIMVWNSSCDLFIASSIQWDLNSSKA